VVKKTCLLTFAAALLTLAEALLSLIAPLLSFLVYSNPVKPLLTAAVNFGEAGQRLVSRINRRDGKSTIKASLHLYRL
jgi:hypothetical protein